MRLLAIHPLEEKNVMSLYLDNVTLGRVMWFHLGLQTATGRTSAVDQMRDHERRCLLDRELRHG